MTKDQVARVALAKKMADDVLNGFATPKTSLAVQLNAVCNIVAEVNHAYALNDKAYQRLVRDNEQLKDKMARMESAARELNINNSWPWK